MQQTTLQYLAEIVASRENKVFTTRTNQLSSGSLKNGGAPEWIAETYHELGGQENYRNIHFKLPEGIETEQVRLSLDGAQQFNRYRAFTLRSGLYQKYQPAWLDGYRRNCRSLERECLKEGTRVGVWANPEAEKHFGPAQEAGDFFGAGSPGWKLKAFQEFLSDVFLFQSSQQHKRISEYERLMVQGKLISLQQLLLSRSESSQQYLIKYLSRQLEIPQEEPQKDQE